MIGDDTDVLGTEAVDPGAVLVDDEAEVGDTGVGVAPEETLERRTRGDQIEGDGT